MFNRIFLVLFVVAALPMMAFAGLFNYTITAYPDDDNLKQSYNQSFDNLEAVFDGVDTAEMEKHIVNYDEDTTPVRIDIDFRGVPVYLTMADSSTEILLRIPAIGLTKTFNGVDRDASVDDLEDWLKDDGDDVVSRLMEVLAADTATDPVAGNPTSAQSRMVALDYDYATSSDEVIEMNAEAMTQEGTLNANMVSIFARYSNYDLDGVSSKTYSLPLAYTIKFNGSKNSLAIRMPITMVNIDGSDAYNVGLGLGFKYFVKDDWSLTPAIGYTAVGSIDMASVAQLVSGSVTSAYTFKVKGYMLTMGNMIGRYETIPFQYQDYSVSPDIKNTVLRNGLNLVLPVGAEKTTSVELFVTDTRYYGSDLYVDSYNEVGFSYGFAKVKQEKKKDKIKNAMSKARVGFTYLFAHNVSGYSVNFGYSF